MIFRIYHIIKYDSYNTLLKLIQSNEYHELIWWRDKFYWIINYYMIEYAYFLILLFKIRASIFIIIKHGD